MAKWKGRSYILKDLFREFLSSITSDLLENDKVQELHIDIEYSKDNDKSVYAKLFVTKYQLNKLKETDDFMNSTLLLQKLSFKMVDRLPKCIYHGFWITNATVPDVKPYPGSIINSLIFRNIVFYFNLMLCSSIYSIFIFIGLEISTPDVTTTQSLGNQTCVCPTPYTESNTYTSPEISNVSQSNREKFASLGHANSTVTVLYNSSSSKTENYDTETTYIEDSSTTTSYGTSSSTSEDNDDDSIDINDTCAEDTETEATETEATETKATFTEAPDSPDTDTSSIDNEKTLFSNSDESTIATISTSPFKISSANYTISSSSEDLSTTETMSNSPGEPTSSDTSDQPDANTISISSEDLSTTETMSNSPGEPTGSDNSDQSDVSEILMREKNLSFLSSTSTINEDQTFDTTKDITSKATPYTTTECICPPIDITPTNQSSESTTSTPDTGNTLTSQSSLVSSDGSTKSTEITSMQGKYRRRLDESFKVNQLYIYIYIYIYYNCFNSYDFTKSKDN